MYADQSDPLAHPNAGMELDDPPPYESIIMDTPPVRCVSRSCGFMHCWTGPITRCTEPFSTAEGCRTKRSWETGAY